MNDFDIYKLFVDVIQPNLIQVWKRELEKTLSELIVKGEIKMTKEIVVFCAWCGRLKDADPPDPKGISDNVVISHGICDECMDKQIQALELLKRDRAKPITK